MNLLNIFVFTLVLGVTLSAKPDYIHVCKKDATLQKCLEDNFYNAVKFLSVNGDSSIKAPDLKAIKIAKMPLKAGDLTVTLIKITFHGMENIKLHALSIDDKMLRIKAECPILQYAGDYILDGKILVLPIQGEGKVNITHYGVQFDLKMKLKTEERNGKKYYFVTGNWDDMEMDLSANKTNFHFDNLFGGDPQLGPQMNSVLNENNVAVVDEILIAFKEGFGFYMILPYINAYLRAIPIDEMFQK